MSIHRALRCQRTCQECVKKRKILLFSSLSMAILCTQDGFSVTHRTRTFSPLAPWAQVRFTNLSSAPGLSAHLYTISDPIGLQIASVCGVRLYAIYIYIFICVCTYTSTKGKSWETPCKLSIIKVMNFSERKYKRRRHVSSSFLLFDSLSCATVIINHQQVASCRVRLGAE